MKNNKNKFSIIIPTCNNKILLSKTIESVLNQKYKNFETIIVDDGSTDGTKDELKKYADKIKYIYQKNQGVSEARNNGLKNATGDYILFVDSDDYIEKDLLEYINKLVNNLNPDVIKFSYVIESKLFRKKYKFKVQTETLIEKKDYNEKIYPFIFTSYDFNPVWNMVVRKDIIKDTKFDNHLINAEDLEFEFQILLNSNNIYISDRTLYHYVYNSNGISQNYNINKAIEKLKNNLKVYNSIHKNLPKEQIYSKQLNIRINKDFEEFRNLIAYNAKSYHDFYEQIKKIENYSKLGINDGITKKKYYIAKIKFSLKKIKQKIIRG